MKLQVGVKIFLQNSEGKYLLLKRSLEKYGKTEGRWDIVGGRIEPGTDLISNLKREIQEETALAITSTPRLLLAQDIIPNDEMHVVRITYTGKTEGEPTLDTDENIEFKWFSIEEMKKHEDIDRYAKEVLDLGLLG